MVGIIEAVDYQDFLGFLFLLCFVLFFVSEGNIGERKQAGRKGRRVD